MDYYLYEGNNSVIFSEDKVPDPYLVHAIDRRFQDCDADALVLGQGPVLSLGFIDPRDWSCTCPNPGAFAVRRDSYQKIGDADEALGAACAADYLYRLEEAGGKYGLAMDIVMPCTKEFPLDITDLWLDGLRLDYKHGNASLRKSVISRIKEAFLHYDSSIGNYSRRKLVEDFPDFLKSLARYSGQRGTKAESFDFFKRFTLRGSIRMEVRMPSRYPLVSIVIRTYKKPESLRKTLECIRHLDYPNLEVVVVEDGSPDAKHMVETDFSDLPVLYHCTDVNVGRAAAANIGFGLASGEWINLLDDDDYLFPEHITVGISEAENTGSDIIFLQSLALETTTKSQNPYEFEIDKMHFMRFPRIDPFTMCGYCMTPDNGVLFRKSLLSDGTGMREDLGANEDWELWLQLMAKGKWSTVHYATSAFVNPLSDEEKKEREEKYSAWRGKQFESPKLVYQTSSHQLSRYFVELLNDVEALEATGGLDRYAQQTSDYYSYSSEELEEEFMSCVQKITAGEDGKYTAKQFNLWYCAVYAHVSSFSGEARRQEIHRLKTMDLPGLPVKRIHFSGFWPWFKNDDNFFLDVLEKRYRVEQVSDPDYLISSIFGVGFYEYILYPCVRIFFSGENYAPDFNLVDYAMSYNPMDYPERYRYIPEFFVDIRRIRNRLKNRLSFEEALETIRCKPEFCNFIYGDSKCCDEREGVFHAINERKKVLSAGTWLNNTENGFKASMLSSKDEVQSRCRFTIAIESYPHAGFVTEKLTDAFLANTIPIYYGDPDVTKIFNPKAFIDVRDFDSWDALAQRIVELDSDPVEMAKMLSEPVFVETGYLDELEDRFANFLYEIFDSKEGMKRPINGQPEVHQNRIAQLQKLLSTGKIK